MVGKPMLQQRIKRRVDLEKEYRHDGYELFEITEAYEILYILDWLNRTRSGFRYNTASSLDAFRENRIYGVESRESDYLYEKKCGGDRTGCDRIFQYKQLNRLWGPNRLHMLPAFCVINRRDPQKCDFI